MAGWMETLSSHLTWNDVYVRLSISEINSVPEKACKCLLAKVLNSPITIVSFSLAQLWADKWMERSDNKAYCWLHMR